ncbi:hypothetical protein ARTHROSP310_33090 [Arthrobacter sp. AD-310]
MDSVCGEASGHAVSVIPHCGIKILNNENKTMTCITPGQDPPNLAVVTIGWQGKGAVRIAVDVDPRGRRSLISLSKNVFPQYENMGHPTMK